MYSGIGYDRMGGDDYKLQEWTLSGSVRLEPRESFDLPTLTVGERMIDTEGHYATDFEHDGAWRFRMEMFVMKFTLVTADWMEWKGIVSEVSAYTPEQEAEVWAQAEPCMYCTGIEEEGTGPHLNLGYDHYSPPKVKGYNGKYVVVRYFLDKS